MTSNEKITVYYRIDKDDTTLDLDFTNWTKMTSTTYSDGVTADGQAEFAFGSDAGVLFYDIQFYLVSERGGTNTLSPVLNGMTLSYRKTPDVKKAWDIEINTAEAARVSSMPKALYDLLMTAVSTKTLISFTFRDGSDSTDTFQVAILPFTGFTSAGTAWKGLFNF